MSAVAMAQDWLDWSRNQFQTHLTAQFSDIRPTLPPKFFFKFPPSDLPSIVPPPVETVNFSPAFPIPTKLYNAALAPAVPITFALVYATIITYLNGVNRRRHKNKKPWAISKTLAFKLFVLAHNIFLSSYSLWTFLGMLKALRVSVVNPREYGLAATVDSLCKMHGPRGFGSAAIYNPDSSTWGIANSLYHLGKDGLTPDSTDVGRIWNEGLAFYGWLFYISKFYEVVDTLIILAKGKQSSLLQTYHHAGAMLCMWAGIRYMSPPIWMFVFVNSFIHYIMYFFYFVTAIGVKVPKPLKQTLTTLQITQFVVGASYAFAHYFVEYQMPVSIPYIYHLREAVSTAIPAIKSDISSAVSVATATASADASAWVKKLALRAAGREGIAENVVNRVGQPFHIDIPRAVDKFIEREETRYHNDLKWAHCLDTSGEAFAIYLNVFYLLPLTWLFAQFFIKSYLQRVDEHRRSSVSDRAYMASRSMTDARKGVGRRLSEAFEDYQGANGENTDEVLTVDEILDNFPSLRKAKREAREARDRVAKASESAIESVSETRDELTGSMKSMRKEEKSALETVSDIVSEKTSQISNSNVVASAQDMYEQLKADAAEGARKMRESMSQSVQSVQSVQSETYEKESSETWNVVQSSKKSVQRLLDEETTSNAADTLSKVEEKANEMSENAAENVKNIGSETKKGKKKNAKAANKTAEKKDATANEARDTQTPSKPKAEVTSASTETPAEEAKVQEGKSFADAAAEGVPEEDMGETIVVEDAVSDGRAKPKAADEVTRGQKNGAKGNDVDEGA